MQKQEYDFQKTMKRKGFVDTQNQLYIMNMKNINYLYTIFRK